MITSEKVFSFVDRLTKVVGDRMCDMCRIGVYGEDCGTPGCHAGWAYIALAGFPPQDGQTNYLDGAELLAEHLGFYDYDELEEWAEDNPDLWGNENGDCMFSHSEAFGEVCSEFPAQVLVDHWRAVGERLREREKRDNLV